MIENDSCFQFSFTVETHLHAKKFIYPSTPMGNPMSAHMGVEAAPEPAGAAEPVAGRKVDRESEGLYWGPVFGAIDRLEGSEKRILTHVAEVAQAAARKLREVEA